MSKEVWLPVVGFENLYCVSNLGRVKSIGRNGYNNGFLFNKKGYIKKLSKTGFYLNTCFYKEGVKYTRNVHRLVALAFIPNPENLPCVCHIKEDLDDNGCLYNGVDNLFWGTHRDNTEDMIYKGRSGLTHKYWEGKKGRLHKSSIKIIQYSKELNLIKVWDGIAEAIRCTGVKGISHCLCGKRKTAGGFIWRYF